ncbi:MAG: hypothetical protein ACWGNP_03230 [Candidatus Bathyarchaeia archaeon]
MAYDPTYTRTDGPTQATRAIDGVWTTPDEWTDGEQTWIGENVYFTSTYQFVSFDPLEINEFFIIEILNDDTNDAGDYWQMCIDQSASGGATPQAGDFKVEVVGHDDVVVYQGDGSGWVAVDPSEVTVTFAESLSDSPMSATPHWIIEFQFNKGGPIPAMDEYWALRVAVYDESNSGDGEQAWPPESEADVPEGYGYQTYTSDPIPEGLTFGVMALLSSISVIVGYKYTKRKETEA